MFWIDQGLLHFGLAKFIQENLDCELYSIFEVTENVKFFLKYQTTAEYGGHQIFDGTRTHIMYNPEELAEFIYFLKF